MRDLQAALRQTSTATLSMQLLKRGVSRVWMRGPVRLSPQQGREQQGARKRGRH